MPACPRLCLIIALLIAGMATAGAVDPPVRVSPDGRSLVRADGSPFFWMGDTAWELFHRLNREEADRYLTRRAQQEFTIIQAVVVAELGGDSDPNPYGQRPFVQLSPTVVPNEAFFTHVDWIVDRAAALGLTIGMLPMWGYYVEPGRLDTPEKTEAYGRYLGQRYRGKPIVWIIGGDRYPDNYLAQWRGLAKGLAIGTSGSEDYSRLLMTYHPGGGTSSSQWFHNDPWLDFNMRQSGHRRDLDVWNGIASDWNRQPAKPAIDGEPLYENHPVDASDVYSNDHDIRKPAYWQLFAGSFGQTYGCHAIWQMYAPGRSPINRVRDYWYDSLDLPGANQMRHVRRLMESRPLLGRIPDQGLITSNAYSGADRIQATRATDGGFAMVYSATGLGFTLDLNRLSGSTLVATWYDPRSGGNTSAGSFARSGTRSFTPPSRTDWVLVVDDAARGYPAPGAGGLNRLPQVAITAPSDGGAHAAPRSITVTADATDPDGSISRVEFFAGDVKVGEDGSAPFAITWNAGAGVHLLSARAIDNRGDASVSMPVAVTVADGGFVMGINCNGDAVTINGRPWRSHASARANGFAHGANYNHAGNQTPIPAVDAQMRAMLNTGIWHNANFDASQPIANGTYDITLYEMENYEPNSNARRWSVDIEGARAFTSVGVHGFSEWRAHGPYRTTVQDRRLDLRFLREVHDPNLMGLTITAVGGGEPQPPVGGGTGLTASYFPRPDLSGTALTRLDATVDFDWGAGAPLAGIGADGFSVRWRGKVEAPTTGTYTFTTTSDDGVRLWVDGRLLIDQWNDHGTSDHSGTIALSAGTQVDLVMEYYENGGGAVARLAWSTSSMSRRIVPASQLYPTNAPPPTQPGLYRAINLNGDALTIDGNAWEGRTAANVSFTGNTFVDQSVALNPPTDAARATMIRSSVWGNCSVTMGAVPNGNYTVYCYVWEDNNSTTFNVTLEGQVVRSNYTSGAAGAWARLGPWPVTISDGNIQLSCSGGDANLSGIEVWNTAGSLPAPWTTTDVGTVDIAGSATVSNGTWTLSGSGADIWDNVDGFRFASRAMSGDGEITARVVSLSGGDAWAKAGVMIRETNTAGSRHAMTVVTPGNGVAFQRRTETGSGSGHTSGALVSAPYWVRLTRVGNTLFSYQSANGTNWTLVGSATIAMSASVQIGLVVTSHNNGQTATAVFDQVTVIAAVGGSG